VGDVGQDQAAGPVEYDPFASAVHDDPYPVYRRLRDEAPVYGTVMEQGRKLLRLFGSANRDERFWDRPDQLDVTRHPAGPLAFRHGLHHCLGAALARLETGVAPEELLPTLGEYTVDHAGCERVHSANVLGCSRLPVVCA